MKEDCTNVSVKENPTREFFIEYRKKKTIVSKTTVSATTNRNDQKQQINQSGFTDHTCRQSQAGGKNLRGKRVRLVFNGFASYWLRK